jgi:hypothetical protein
MLSCGRGRVSRIGCIISNTSLKMCKTDFTASTPGPQRILLLMMVYWTMRRSTRTILHHAVTLRCGPTSWPTPPLAPASVDDKLTNVLCEMPDTILVAGARFPTYQCSQPIGQNHRFYSYRNSFRLRSGCAASRPG